jgi:ABC-type multidrug transport system fused ATPase/permease subunit
MINGGTDTYFEEDKVGKIYDSIIMKWLWSYIKPYWKVIILNFFMLILLTGFHLSLPFLYKIGIDRYISPTGKEIFKIDEIPTELKDRILKATENRFFINLASVRETIKGEMEDGGII